MNNKNIKVVDEHSIDRNANVMFAFDLEGSEYVTYWIERDEDNGNIFVSKVIKNLDGTFNMLDIDDSMEKSKLSDIVKLLITNAINDQSDKLDKTSVTLSDGKVVKFMTVSFNKEQRINVQKTYITTVKKEVTRVAEKYYAFEVKLEESNVFDDIFPTITPVAEPVHGTTPSELDVPNVEIKEEVPVVAPVIPEPVLITPVVETPSEVKSDSFVTFGTETTMPKTEVSPQVISTVAPVASQLPEEPKIVPEVVQPVPTVVESITVAEPTVNVVTPEPVNNASQPLIFNAAKETNLNAALGEVANSTSIPVENIQPVREFGVDEVAKTPVNVAPATTPVQPESTSGQKAGFANSKFFMVVAVAFFLASCIFLGYEVFNYFQLTK